MERLGEKTHARRVMDDADVPIVPGTTEPVTDVEAVTEFGDEHGYPVAIKAEGGGGGRGMKVVESADEAEKALESAKREGEAYFSNDSVYLERYLQNPRHIEVQIVADDPRVTGPSTRATWSTSASATARSSAATRR